MNNSFRTVFFLFCISASAITVRAQNLADFFDKTNALLEKNVMDGKVNYAALKADDRLLRQLIKTIQTADAEKYDALEKKAFYINAYNLTVIQTIVAAYPINSPMDIVGFFDTKSHTIAGKKMTLDHLENKVLRATYKDPLLHFVLVCGATGCPPIIPQAYYPANLDRQMGIQAKKAINHDFVRVDVTNEKVALSEICNWYKEDFQSDKLSTIEFLNAYRTEKIPLHYKTSYFNYDWSLNDVNVSKETTSVVKTNRINENQIYNPGTLLRKGKVDLTAFNSIYTQDKSNWLGTEFSGFRETFYTTWLQFTYGTSKNARINLGLDINLKASARRTDSSYSTITAPYVFKNNDSNRVGITSIGARIKISPFRENNDFSIQSTFYFPTVKHPEGFSDPSGNENLYWADWDRYVWWNQFFYTCSFGDKFQLFSEVDLLFRFAKNKNQLSFLDIPLNIITSYFPTNRITLYALAQYVPRFPYDTDPQNSMDWVISSSYTSIGGGMKYQLTEKIQLELLYSNFVSATNAGLGESFNLGIKFLN